MEFVTEFLVPHWPFFSAVLVFMLIGQVMTKSVFSRNAHWTKRPVWLYWWGRKTLPLHPIAAGMLLGLFWRDPEPLVTSTQAAMAYFAMAGGVSVAAYEILKGLAKKRGYDLNIPGLESAPPSVKKEVKQEIGKVEDKL